MTTTMINVTDLRNNLADYLDLVRFKKQALNISRRGKVIAQITHKTQSKENYSKAVKMAANTFSIKNHSEWKSINNIVKWVNKGRKKSERY